MSKTIEISRELAERLALPPKDGRGWTTWNSATAYEAAKELMELLAAPVVERQGPVVSEADLIAAGLGYPMSKEEAVKTYKASLQPRTDHPSNEDCEWCHGCGHDYYGEPCVGCCKPSPVAFTTQGMLDIAKQIPLTGRIGAKVTKDDRWNVPLYTSPPAPVAVVLPEPLTTVGKDWELQNQAFGWNACLDKVKELNQ